MGGHRCPINKFWYPFGLFRTKLYLYRHPKSVLIPLKTEMSKILPSSLANKLACHSFMNAGRTNQISRWDRKDSFLLTLIAVAAISALLCWFPKSNYYRVTWRGPDDTSTHYRLFYKKGNPREPESFMMGSNYACPGLQKETFSLY